MQQKIDNDSTYNYMWLRSHVIDTCFYVKIREDRNDELILKSQGIKTDDPTVIFIIYFHKKNYCILRKPNNTFEESKISTSNRYFYFFTATDYAFLLAMNLKLHTMLLKNCTSEDQQRFLFFFIVVSILEKFFSE